MRFILVLDDRASDSKYDTRFQISIKQVLSEI